MSTPMTDTHLPQLSAAQRSLARRVPFFDGMPTPKKHTQRIAERS